MGLACSQIRLLTLTYRKADIELGITKDAAQKQAVLRDMSELSSEYYKKLQNKRISYYANNKYNTINYNYIMGSTLGAGGAVDLTQVADSEKSIKNNNSMILTDYKGYVFLSSYYANIFANVMGLNSTTSGGVCNPSNNQYAEMIYKITNGAYSQQDFLTAICNKSIQASVETTDGSKEDSSDAATTDIQKYVNFYLPILKAAAANGWTTEYEEYAQNNSEYISDALISGTLQLATVDTNGNYTTNESLNYFVTAGYVQTDSSADTREELTAWYEEEKLILTNKETYWDTEISNLSSELEAIKTEIDSIKSLIDDGTKKFNWNN